MVTIKNCIDWFQKNGNRIIAAKEIEETKIISRPRAVDEADEEHISFITNKYSSSFKTLLNSTRCKLILLETALLEDVDKTDLPKDITFIISDNPKKDLTNFANQFFAGKTNPEKTRIHTQASVSETAKIGEQTLIGAFAVVEDNVIIGDRCTIGSSSVIKKDTIIGDDVQIGSCSVIGSDGFGFVQIEGSKGYERFSHFGRVIIKDKVSIGNNTCIDRGSLKDTVIGKGVKIDNLVHIAHNVKIGENTLVIACSMIAGSVTIGKNSWVAPSSSIRNGLTLGENVTIGLASTVTRNLAGNQTVIGSPALPEKDFFILNSHRKEIIAEKKKDVNNEKKNK